MPDAKRIAPVLAGLLAFLAAAPAGARAQQPDSAAVRDSLARADSVRADSVRRAELARIRGEPRAPVAPPEREPAAGAARWGVGHNRPPITGASVSADMVADVSPRAAARQPGSRVRMRDIEGLLAGSFGARMRYLVALTLTDDGTAQRIGATDAAVFVPLAFAGTELVAGRTALPFGRIAQLHRHELELPDEPLPVRVLLGENGLRGTGLQLRSSGKLAGMQVILQLAAADRFGARIDSLHPGEPADQSIDGLAAGGRLGARFGMARSRVDIGVSSITGKREQPIGCVYNGTVGPVPCPEAVNAANTRLTVLGADGRLAWGGDAFVIDGEWLHLIVGATDMPVFSNAGFVPFYRGVNGTYDGGFVGARVRVTRLVGVGARGEWLQNPEVGGLNDAWAGGYLELGSARDARVTASYQRRVPSTTALATLTPADRDARDRVVLRGTVVIGRHPGAGRD